MQSRNLKGYLRFININRPDFSSDLKYSISYKQAMERIHALKSDDTLIKDIKIFQEAYSLIGLRWIYAPTKFPIFDNLLILFIAFGQNID